MKSKLTKSFFRPMTISALMRKRFAAELFFLIVQLSGGINFENNLSRSYFIYLSDFVIFYFLVD